jgi:hypothetical protein
MTKGYTIRGLDGAFIRIEETEEGDQIVVSLRRDAAVQTIRLGLSEWNALCNLKYALNVVPLSPENSRTSE